jgi:integrase
MKMNFNNYHRKAGKRKRSKLPTPFTVEQLINLFDCIDNPQTIIGAGLGLFCALRILEVVSLMKQHVLLDKKTIKVVDGKGGKDEYVIIPEQFIEPLRLWLDFVGDTPYVFPSRKDPEKHIGRSEMFRKYCRALEKAGLRIRQGTKKYQSTKYGNYIQPRFEYYFHTLRHTYATYLLDKGIDISIISKLMRHNQVDTTMIYTRISSKRKQQAVDDAFDPFKAYKFKKSEFQDHREQVRDERERRLMLHMSNPMHLLQMKLVNGELSPVEYNERLAALKGVPGKIEVEHHGQL